MGSSGVGFSSHADETMEADSSKSPAKTMDAAFVLIRIIGVPTSVVVVSPMALYLSTGSHFGGSKFSNPYRIYVRNSFPPWGSVSLARFHIFDNSTPTPPQ